MIPSDDLIMAGARARARAMHTRVESLLASPLAPSGMAAREYGAAIAIRKPPYFTRLMAAHADVIPQLDQIIAWLGEGGDSDVAFEVPPIDANQPLQEALARRGFYCWRAQALLACERDPTADNAPLPPGVGLRVPDVAELPAYMRTFTEGFSTRNEWDEDDRRAREREMLYEYGDKRYWRLLLATVDGEHAGIGTLWVDGDTAFFSNGATVPAHRRRGVHGALIRARQRVAAEAGVRQLFVDTTVSSIADRNLQRHGFRLITHIGMWRRLSEAKAS